MNLRRVTQVSVIIAALSWAGYSVSSHVQALSDSDTRNAAHITATDSQNIEEDYAGLPEGVTRSVKSVVAVQRITSSAATDNAVIASGVILNHHQVLTAGHATSNGSGALSCTDTTVNAPGFATPAEASANPVTFASALHSDNADLAVMTVNADQNYKNLPQISVASALPKPGDTVYFINYQPQADGTIRDPLSKTNDSPVVFSGTVVGSDSQGLQIAAGGGISYGHGQAETLLRKGASGGAIVNRDGDLVGLSVSSQSLAANRTPQYIGTNFGIALPDGKYQIVNAQTVSQQLLTKLQSNMTACQ